MGVSLPTSLVESLAADVHRNWHSELRKQEKGIGPENWKQITEKDRDLFRVAVKTVMSKLAVLDKVDREGFTAMMGAVMGHSWHELKVPAGPMVPKDILMYLASSKHGLIRDDKLTVMLVMGFMCILTGLPNGLSLTPKQVEASIEALLHTVRKKRGH